MTATDSTASMEATQKRSLVIFQENDKLHNSTTLITLGFSSFDGGNTAQRRKWKPLPFLYHHYVLYLYSILYFCTDLYYFYVCRLVVWYWMNAISSTALTYIWIVFSTYSTVYSGYKGFFERGQKLSPRFRAHLNSGIPTISLKFGFYHQYPSFHLHI